MGKVEMTYANAINVAISEEMRKDETVFMLGEDIGVYRGAFGVSGGMIEEFGSERIMDTPISETGFVGAAIGAAVSGMRPVVEIMFSDFMAVCWDMILNQAPKMHYMFGGKVDVPMVLRTPSGGGTGAAAQHSQSLEAMLCHIPGLKVIVPSTPEDAKGLLKSAIRDNNPVIFLEQKLLYRTKGMVPEEEYYTPIGKADIKKEGTDCTIVTYGRMTHMCLSAADTLASEGKSVEVIDLRTLLPMDKDAIIESVKKTKHLLVVHEAVKTGGIGGEIAATIAETDAFFHLDAPIKRLASEDVPVPFSPILEKGILPDEDKIAQAVRELLGDQKSEVPKITPLALAMANDLGVEIAAIKGTGFGGKITKEDVLQAIESAESTATAGAGATPSVPKTGGVRRVKLSGMRKVVAERMSQSHTEIPCVTHNMKSDVTELMEVRTRINGKREKVDKISLNDFVLKAVAIALERHPDVLTSINGDEMLYHEDINIGMAVAVPNGLLVPVLKHVDQMRLDTLSKTAKDLAVRARDGKLEMDEYKGSTFTISNLGMYEVESFTPIVNQPNAGILGVCTVTDEVRVIDGNFVARKMMGLSFTHDHRILDGAPAASFLREVKHLLQDPMGMLVD